MVTCQILCIFWCFQFIMFYSRSIEKRMCPILELDFSTGLHFWHSSLSIFMSQKVPVFLGNHSFTSSKHGDKIQAMDMMDHKGVECPDLKRIIHHFVAFSLECRYTCHPWFMVMPIRLMMQITELWLMAPITRKVYICCS